MIFLRSTVGYDQLEIHQMMYYTLDTQETQKKEYGLRLTKSSSTNTKVKT
jgi:hypothetical protein